MPRAPLVLAVLVAALAAPPARAQLGIDLAPPAATKKKDTKKKKTAPAQKPKSTSAPAEKDQLPPAIAPSPAPAPPAAQASPAVPPAPGEPTIAEPPPPPAKKKGGEQMPALTLTPEKPPSAESKARLDAAKKLLAEGATETAALAFDQILREKALSDVHDEARYQRGKALARLKLGHSALAAFDEILDRGPAATRFYNNAMEWEFYVGRQLSNEQPLMTRVAKHAGQGLPPAYEDRVNYLLAKYEFERGRALADAGRAAEAKAAWGDARRLASKVRGTPPLPPPAADAKKDGKDAKDVPPPPPEGDVFARAKFVDGLVLYAQGDDQGATEVFKDVVRLTNPKRTANADQDLRELAFLQLARIHYQNRQNRYAIFYYGKMPWGGERWLEGLWEASYAHYRIGDYEKTLGNLITLQSPYFQDEYFPESYVLKAIVYYENCRYPEARRVLEQFSRTYEPVYDELVKITGAQKTPQGYYELVRDAARTPGGGPMRKIMRVAYSDQAVARLSESIGEVEREMDEGVGGRRAEFRGSALAKELLDKLRASRASMIDEAGARTRAKLEAERDALRQLLAQALRIQIEVSRKEREALEGSLAKGSQVEVVRDLKYSHAVSDEHLYWPYEGEFWRDELGTYSYTLTKGCKDRVNRPRSAAR
jgi:tetratricopeptide (TPR) repeat protein